MAASLSFLYACKSDMKVSAILTSKLRRTPKGRGTYCFGADPVGVGVSVGVGVTLSCLHDIS